MSLRLLAVVLVWLALLMFYAGPVRAAEPTLEVHPERSHCVVPFEVTATGLDPGEPVEVFMQVAGQVTGAVAGQSTSQGEFFSPIPMILLPCAEGGEVIASIEVDGELLDVTATFEVAEPIPPSATVTPTPAQAGSAPTPHPPEVGSGPTTRAAERSSLWVLAAVAGVAVVGSLLTWKTRDRD